MTVRPRLRPAQTRGMAAQRQPLMSVRRSWTPYKPVRTLTLLPFRSPTPDAAHYIIAIAVDIDKG